MASSVRSGMRVTRDTSARPMRLVSRWRRNVVPTVSMLTKSSYCSWAGSCLEHLHAELPRRRLGGDVAALLAVLLPLGVAKRLADPATTPPRVLEALALRIGADGAREAR